MRGYRLSEDDRLRRALISRLLCHAVIRKDEIAIEFAVNFDDYFAPELARLAPFVEDRLVEYAPGEIRVTLLGRIFIRNVALLFDPYLEKQRLAEKPLFSKTLYVLRQKADRRSEARQAVRRSVRDHKR